MKYSTYITNTVAHLIPDRAEDYRTISVYVIVEKVFEEIYYVEDDPPKYRIMQALGFEHIVGEVFWPASTELRELK